MKAGYLSGLLPLAVALPVVVAQAQQAKSSPHTADASMTDHEMTGEPLTVDAIEAANTYPDDGRIPHVPFGFANEEWQRFKASMQPGDRIYTFGSAPESWKALAGRAGYVLVRHGKPVAQMVTLIN